MPSRWVKGLRTGTQTAHLFLHLIFSSLSAMSPGSRHRVLLKGAKSHHHLNPPVPFHLKPFPWQTGSWSQTRWFFWVLAHTQLTAHKSFRRPFLQRSHLPPGDPTRASPGHTCTSRLPFSYCWLICSCLFTHLLFFSPNQNTSSIPGWFMYDLLVMYPQPGAQ